MEDILFEIPKAFVPEPTHIQILQVVADNPSCHISDVVHQLLPDHSESSVRFRYSHFTFQKTSRCRQVQQ